MYSKYLKRIIDILLGSLVLILVFPLFLIVFVSLFILNRGNVFFYQQRPGYQEAPFWIIKFKTMTDQANEDGQLLPNHERITRVGHWIRKLSLDELPQLLNVLRGDMSLIGPRPLLPKYLPLYTDEQRRRHSVRPGITGWAQVNGRNAISWEQKFEYDIYYVDHCTFGLDLKIILLTLRKVLKQEGINQSSQCPMEPFKGGE